ncbi:MAG: hypothetical protein AABY65_01670, partial [Nitrospirota bacterium]
RGEESVRRKRRFSKEVEDALRKHSPPPGGGRARVGVVERGNASTKIWATPTQNPDAPKSSAFSAFSAVQLIFPGSSIAGPEK